MGVDKIKIVSFSYRSSSEANTICHNSVGSLFFNSFTLSLYYLWLFFVDHMSQPVGNIR